MAFFAPIQQQPLDLRSIANFGLALQDAQRQRRMDDIKLQEYQRGQQEKMTLRDLVMRAQGGDQQALGQIAAYDPATFKTLAEYAQGQQERQQQSAALESMFGGGGDASAALQAGYEQTGQRGPTMAAAQAMSQQRQVPPYLQGIDPQMIRAMGPGEGLKFAAGLAKAYAEQRMNPSKRQAFETPQGIIEFNPETGAWENVFPMEPKPPSRGAPVPVMRPDGTVGYAYPDEAVAQGMQRPAPSSAAQGRPIAVMGPDGRPVYVNAEDAIGAQPAPTRASQQNPADLTTSTRGQVQQNLIAIAGDRALISDAMAMFDPAFQTIPTSIIGKGKQAIQRMTGSMDPAVANLLERKTVWEATLENLTAGYRNRLFGATLTENERKSAARFLPDVGKDSPSQITAKLRQLDMIFERAAARDNAILRNGLSAIGDVNVGVTQNPMPPTPQQIERPSQGAASLSDDELLRIIGGQ